MLRLKEARAFVSEAANTATFRIAIAFAATFSAAALLLFGFVYWQTAGLETNRVDRYIETQAATLSQAAPQEIMWAVQSHLAEDLHRVSFIALFDSDHALVAGNMREVPSGLRFDGRAYPVEVDWVADGVAHRELVRAVGRVLPDGRLLLVGRNIEQLINLRKVVARALDLGVIPAVLLSVIGGVFFSLRDVHRARRVYRALERIMDGNLSERLPASAQGDDFDRLAASVNRVLDELQRMLYEVRGVGDDIAHDLRGPLTRVRTRLERARGVATTVDEFHTAIDHAIHALDQVFGVITALLRIGEIDSRHRRAGFAPVMLPDIVREVGELYEPIAESRNIRFSVQPDVTAPVQGDRELLVEALINLVDNAVKYTPSGGYIEVTVTTEAAGAVMRVRDTGVGISTSEKNSIMQPYYRSATTRNLPGTGIGLSLVGAIVRLHDFTMIVRDSHPGTAFEIHCYMLRSQEPPARGDDTANSFAGALIG